jgi:hypothetical protein
MKDENGDENFNLFVVEPSNGEVRNLTPIPKVAARIVLPHSLDWRPPRVYR